MIIMKNKEEERFNYFNKSSYEEVDQVANLWLLE